jgi:hypothetical protein
MLALLLAVTFPAVAAAAMPNGLASGAIAECRAVDREAAAKCLVDRLSGEELAHLRVDEGFDPSVYRAISDAFDLRDASSPVSRSLAEEGLYSPELSPAVLILLAQAKAKGTTANLQVLREITSLANRDQQEKRAAWQPPMLPGTKRVALKDCPDMPQRRHPQAACLKDQEGKLIIVTPNWGPEEAPRGN